jgi:hypothetical protein
MFFRTMQRFQLKSMSNASTPSETHTIAGSPPIEQRAEQRAEQSREQSASYPRAQRISRRTTPRFSPEAKIRRKSGENQAKFKA